MACHPRPWKPGPWRACISSAKWWTSPAGWAATTSSGPGRRAGWQGSTRDAFRIVEFAALQNTRNHRVWTVRKRIGLDYCSPQYYEQREEEVPWISSTAGVLHSKK